MARKRRKKRRGFWAWLMGREPDEPAGRSPPATADDQGRPATAEPPAAVPAAAPSGEAACGVCGGSSFRWGWLESGLYGTGKGPSGARQPKYVKEKTRFGDFIGLRARLCDDCGHVELFASRDEEE